MRSNAIFNILVGVAQVAAHGGVYNFTIDGVDYNGQYPWLPEESQTSIQRRWAANPITRLDHPMLACNRGYPLQKKMPSLSAPVPAGGRITASFDPPPCPEKPYIPKDDEVPFPELDGSPVACIELKWYHHQGPITVYLADCEGPCEEWDATGKRWFKIYESGYSPTGWPPGSISKAPITEPRTWKQNTLGGGLIDITIPKNLKPGSYLMRHEVYYSEGEEGLNPQLYPSCANIEVTGNGTAFPSEDYLVSFPGVYNETDPAFANQGDKHMLDRQQTYNYTVPGPKVWGVSKKRCH